LEADEVPLLADNQSSSEWRRQRDRPPTELCVYNGSVDEPIVVWATGKMKHRIN